jgi:hypothetical protein
MWHPSAARPEPLTRGTRASHELESLSTNCGDGDVGGRRNEGDVLTIKRVEISGRSSNVLTSVILSTSVCTNCMGTAGPLKIL